MVDILNIHWVKVRLVEFHCRRSSRKTRKKKVLVCGSAKGLGRARNVHGRTDSEQTPSAVTIIFSMLWAEVRGELGKNFEFIFFQYGRGQHTKKTNSVN